MAERKEPNIYDQDEQGPVKFIAGEKGLYLNPAWVAAHPEYQEAQDMEKKMEEEKRLKSLEIPSDVKRGSAGMLWHTMNRQIKVNSHAIEKGDRNKQSLETTEKLKEEFDILKDIMNRKANRMSYERTRDGQDFNIGQANTHIAEYSAADLIDDVQQLIDKLEDMDPKEKEITWTIGNFRKEYEVKKLLKSLKNLQRRLIDEGVKFEDEK